MAKPETSQSVTAAAPSWRWVGERGLRVVTAGFTLERYHLLTSHPFIEIEDVIPAHDTLLVILRPGAAPSSALQKAMIAPMDASPRREGTCHRLPVQYGGDSGPDLADLAAHAGMDRSTYVERHAAAEYTVAFLGFQPGFPYLSGLPDGLSAARKATPRTRVDAGSIGIGGGYTGIYPGQGPGGWHIIGRTRAVLFDPLRASPALLMPGDRVRFVAE